MNKEELAEEFFKKFAVFSKGSNSDYWWKVPHRSTEKEKASPVEVWEWIETKLLNPKD